MDYFILVLFNVFTNNIKCICKSVTSYVSNFITLMLNCSLPNFKCLIEIANINRCFCNSKKTIPFVLKLESKSALKLMKFFLSFF